MEQNQTTALQKAHSAAHHLHRIMKAVNDFHEKMGGLHKAHLEKVNALHKAHHEDLTKAFGQLHKILGVEQVGSEYGSEPAADSLSGGTANLQTFKAATSNSQAISASSPTETVEVAVQKALDSFAAELVKAFSGSDPEPQQQAQVPGGSQVQNFVQQQVRKAEGVGDRNNLAPVPVNVVPITKAQDASGQVPQPTTLQQPVTTATVEKAMSGDVEAVRAMFKGVKPMDVPAVLLEPLSKVH